eukprot:3323284-Pleurochrysis_carterae.AAC.1
MDAKLQNNAPHKQSLGACKRSHVVRMPKPAPTPCAHVRRRLLLNACIMSCGAQRVLTCFCDTSGDAGRGANVF